VSIAGGLRAARPERRVAEGRPGIDVHEAVAALDRGPVRRRRHVL